jgi:lambda family phage portal protein
MSFFSDVAIQGKDLYNAIKKKITSAIPKKPTKPEINKTASHGRSGFTGYNSGGAKWSGGLSTYSSHTTIDHGLTRAAARNMMQDVPQARALVERFSDTVADTGLVLEALPKFRQLGTTPEKAEIWGADVSERFDMWAKSKKSCISETYNFYQAQRMYAMWQQRDNDMFTQLHYSKKKSLLSPLQFGFIDPNQITGCSITSADYQFLGADGIERDSNGKELSYNVYVNTGRDIKEVNIKRKGPRSGRTFMLHGYSPEFAHQGRGYSRISHAIQEFENITDFSLAQIKKAINQSNFLFSVENQQMDPSNPLANTLSNPGGIFNKTVPETGTVSDNGKSFDYCPLPESVQRTPGSLGVVNMQQGDHLTLLENKTPAEGFEAFITPFVSYLSASIGMPIEMLLMKFNSSYSASRASLVVFWRIAQIWRNEMIADFLNPIKEAWLSEEIAGGRISAPGWQDPHLRAAWMGGNWIGSPMPNIDPKREADASATNIKIGATTQNRVARNLNGSSAEENINTNRRFFPQTPVPPWEPQQQPQNQENKNDNESEDIEDA